MQPGYGYQTPEFAFAADQPTSIWVRRIYSVSLGAGLATARLCDAAFRFAPEEGRHYRATYARTANGCSISLVSSASAMSETVRPEDFQVLQPIEGQNPDSSFCSD